MPLDPSAMEDEKGMGIDINNGFLMALLLHQKLFHKKGQNSWVKKLIMSSSASYWAHCIHRVID